MENVVPAENQPRVVRVKSLWLVALYGLVFLGLLGYWQREFFRDQLRAVVLGNLELASERFGSNLPDSVDRVDIAEIVGPDAGTNTISAKIDGHLNDYRISTHRVLSGQAAAAFANSWRAMRFGWGLSALCHQPAFLLTFKSGDKTYLQTTVCLECQNFYAPSLFGSVLIGFDKRDAAGVKLMKQFKTLFPDSGKWAAIEVKERPDDADRKLPPQK